MEIIDSQFHPPAPWLAGWDENGGEEEFKLATELTLAYMDAAGIDKAVISWDIGWAEYAAIHAPERLASTPTLSHPHEDLGYLQEQGFEEKFAEFINKPGVIGYRQMLNYPDPEAGRLKAGGFDPLFEACQKLEVPLLISVMGDPLLAVPIAQKYPNLQLILNHIGTLQPPVQTPDSPPWKVLPQLLELAQYDNVAVQLSGAPTLSADPYPYKDLWPHLHQIFEAFGAERLIWGADITRVTDRIAHYPSANVGSDSYPGRHNYAESLGYLRDTDQISEAEKELVLGGSFSRIFGWASAELTRSTV